MQYNEFIDKLSNNKAKDIAKCLENCKRNNKLEIYEDYYNGKHWDLAVMGGATASTRFTRSGKEAWKKFDDNPSKGFTMGELKVWNWIKLIVDVYAHYVRGIETEDVKVSIKDNDKMDDELSDQANDIFGNLNEWVIDATRLMSVFGVIATKYNTLNTGKTDGDEPAILKAITLDQDESVTGLVEFVNPKQIEPIYWYNDFIRGYIRFYLVDGEYARREYGVTKRGASLLYWEAWYIDDKGKLVLKKYIEDQELINEGNSPDPYVNLPYSLQSNEKSISGNFDLNHVEISDVAKNLDLQDDLNAFLTDLNILYRQVAIPMLKASDEFVKNAKKGDMQRIKDDFAKISTQLGNILFAPLEKMDAPGTDANQVVYLNNIIDQLYRQSGIPSSVLNSEGIANVARETLDHLFQSLNVVIGNKRTHLTEIIERNVKLHLIQTKKWKEGLEIEVYFPDIFSMGTKDIGDMIIQGKQAGILPTTYAVEKYVEALGDSDDTEEILAQLQEEDVANKLIQDTLFARADANQVKKEEAQANHNNQDNNQGNGNDNQGKTQDKKTGENMAANMNDQGNQE